MFLFIEGTYDYNNFIFYIIRIFLVRVRDAEIDRVSAQNNIAPTFYPLSRRSILFWSACIKLYMCIHTHVYICMYI